MSDTATTILGIVTAVIGLAMLAVFLSQRAQTSTVIQTSGNALANIIAAAVSPLGGGGNDWATNFSSSTPIGGITP